MQLIAKRVWAAERGPLLFAVTGVSVMLLLGLYLAGWLGGQLAEAVPAAFVPRSMTDYLPVWIVEAGFSLILWRWIVRTQGASLAAESGQVSQAFLLLIWLALDMFMVIIGGGFLAHMDTPWAQMSTAKLSPAHLVTFIAVMPAYIVFGVASWLFAFTRLPEFAQGKLDHFVVITLAPFMFLPVLDPQDLIHSFDPNHNLYLVVYWTVTIAWTANIGWLLMKLFRYILAKLQNPR
ncbi:MAG: hypothetical protein CVU17_03990 [Betaproteobacteria bacterium HGW-Betaproteobacteria-11]|nr:MAG: hypothetical protein CVU17_03990 [Betaproteobacteria bacterium HGW-Betaproteobacteria-11]